MIISFSVIGFFSLVFYRYASARLKRRFLLAKIERRRTRRDSEASMQSGDGSLDWEAITEAMIQRTGKTVLRADLQTVWKYIAYGKRRTRPTDEDAEQVTYSDDEQPFYQPFSAVKRHKVHATAQLQKIEAAKKGSTAAASTAAVYQSQQVLAPTVSEAMRVDQLCKQIQVKGSFICDKLFLTALP
jgi:hypothetical protein